MLDPDQALSKAIKSAEAREKAEKEVQKYIDLHIPAFLCSIEDRAVQGNGETIFCSNMLTLEHERKYAKFQLTPLPLLPMPTILAVSQAEVTNGIFICALAPTISPPARYEQDVSRFIDTPNLLNPTILEAVCSLLCKSSKVENITAEKILSLLPSQSTVFLQLVNVLGLHQPALFREILLLLLDRDLLNEPTLEAIYVICTISTLDNDYLDCFTNSCFRQLTRDSAGKQRIGLFISFLLQMTRSDFYRFQSRADVWRARYPEIVAQFPLALTEG